MKSILLSLFFLAQLLSSAFADPLQGAKRILFLGDSITDSGHYVVLLEAALKGSHPEAEFINLGLSSEGCTGLSEPAHPFPRPNVHERLDRALAKVNPDVVFACYGMNDGIYYPFSEERFKSYQAGINKLSEKVEKRGAKLYLLTSPPFDPLPLKDKGKLIPADSKEFSWMKIYEHYDRDVLARYAKWLLARQGQAKVIDLHRPMTAFLIEQRMKEPSFHFSSDGIHPNKQGHQLMAETIHQALYQKPLPKLTPDRVALISKRQRILHAAWLTHVGHKRPGMRAGLPLDEARKRAASLK